MLNKTIVEYIRASRNAKMQEYFIRQALLEAGWTKEDIDEALDSEEAWPPEARTDFTEEKIKKTYPAHAGEGMRHRPATRLKIAGGFIIVLVTGLAVWGYTRLSDLPRQIILPTNDQSSPEFQFGSWSALGDAEFFKQAKDRLIDQKTDFIEADLTEMKLKVYKAGQVEKEVPILSRGREGSWWETPAGLYQIQSKEPDHFSSFGQVYMPWSMAFQGNFFIHGWPYYRGGEPVAAGYSGGCIRLSTEDAKTVYNLSGVNMPVLVFEQGFGGDSFKYNLLEDQIHAKNFLGADLKNNFAFAAKDTTSQVPIASLTKLMTAIIATEYINVEQSTVITSDMLVPTSKPRLVVGQKVSVLHLLYPLLTESSNEAAAAISKILGTEKFVGLMNGKAKAIGMRDTNFVDPAGSGQGNTSTAQDLFQLAKYLYNNRSFILAISKGSQGQSAYDPPTWQHLENFNIFQGDPDFIGGKVGKSSSAGETVLSVFEIESAGIRRPVVVVVLGSENGAEDATALIGFIKNSY